MTTIYDLQQAVTLYRKRQSRRVHPAGIFDKAGRWYPSESEHQPCCNYIRPPTRRWPYSLMVHCRTIVHVASLYNVDADDLRRAIRTSSATPTS